MFDAMLCYTHRDLIEILLKQDIIRTLRLFDTSNIKFLEAILMAVEVAEVTNKKRNKKKLTASPGI